MSPSLDNANDKENHGSSQNHIQSPDQNQIISSKQNEQIQMVVAICPQPEIAIKREIIEQYESGENTFQTSTESRIRNNLNLLKPFYVEILQLHQQFLATPWLNNHYMNVSKRRLITLFALYKCCAANCIFSTNDEHKMKNHIFEHVLMTKILREANPEYIAAAESDSAQPNYNILCRWSDCAYCDFKNDSPEKLVRHVKTFHGRCPFQCSHCFFRAADISYFDDHFKTYHAIGKREVLICNVSVSSNQMQKNKLFRDRMEYVLPFKCGKGKKLTHKLH